MKIAYFPNQTALQSEPVWQSFLLGCKQIGIEPVENSRTADMAVIWSVLWNGRMRGNQAIYEHYRRLNKPVFIIEVGALDRGRTWKISANHITADGVYGNKENLDSKRSEILRINLDTPKISRKDAILIVGQHERSLQWQGQSLIKSWLQSKVYEIQKITDRPIVFRPHPRHLVNVNGINGVILEQPVKIAGSYDKFNIDFNYHCVIGHNGGTLVQAAVAGTPIVCDKTSIAHPVASDITSINQISLPDRSVWFQQILHTEWTIDEIQLGIPQKRILDALNR